MAESMQYEFPVSDSKEQSSGKIIEHTDTGKTNTKQTPTTDLPEVLGEKTPTEYTIEEYYSDDDLGKEVLQNKYLAPCCTFI